MGPTGQAGDAEPVCTLSITPAQRCTRTSASVRASLWLRTSTHPPTQPTRGALSPHFMLTQVTVSVTVECGGELEATTCGCCCCGRLWLREAAGGCGVGAGGVSSRVVHDGASFNLSLSHPRPPISHSLTSLCLSTLCVCVRSLVSFLLRRLSLSLSLSLPTSSPHTPTGSVPVSERRGRSNQWAWTPYGLTDGWLIDG